MSRSKRAGIALICLGLLLLASALLLMIHNRQESVAAGKAADQALYAVQQAIAEQTVPPSTVPAETGAGEETTAPVEPTEAAEAAYVPEDLTVVEIDGHEYIGYLYVPSLDLSLPVMKLKYFEDLQEAPCLQIGSPLTDDAVIAAHNYPTHFGPLRDLKGGEEIRFIDMTGYTIGYTVQGVRTVDPKETPDLTQEPYDLTLYTCTTGGQARVVVSCDRTETTA